jgi:chromate reductase, NAD(P)H dehydrogenase (quinone)
MSIDDVRLLAISGSLRAVSSNGALLRAATELAPPGVQVTLFDALGELPHFNPDADLPEAHPAVGKLRSAIARADGLLISSPEYAHGVPGVLKNGLDWLVSGIEIVGMPVALLNAAPRATHAQASLAETLRTMAARVLDHASPSLHVSGRRIGTQDIVHDPALAAPLREAVALLAEAAVAARADGSRVLARPPDPATSSA